MATSTPMASRSGAADLSFTTSGAAMAAASVVLPPILGDTWNDDRVEIRSRRRRKEVEVLPEDSTDGREFEAEGEY